MPLRYHIGEKVRLVTESESLRREHQYWIPSMAYLYGATVVIERVDPLYEEPRYYIENEPCFFTDEMIECSLEPECELQISFDDLLNS